MPRKFTNNFARWLNLGLITLTLLSYLSPYINPNHFWPIALLGLIYPILLVLNLFFIFYWLIKKRRYFLFSLTCVLLGWSFLTKNVGFNKENLSEEQRVKILSYNTHSGRNFLNPETKKRSGEAFANYINSKQADIICMQEFYNNPHYKKIRGSKGEKFYFTESQPGPIVIASAFPIVKEGGFGFINASNGTVFADIDINGTIIRVYNVHLKSNEITIIADEVAASRDLRERETWSKIKTMLKGYRRATKIRAAQTKEITEHIAQSPYPVLICGDFNDVPQSYVYQQLSQGKIDHFQETGRGMGSTFAGSIPFLRIDYILSSPAIKTLRTEVIKDEYSDHYPIVSEINFQVLGHN
ncbi:MAG: endonuclease/exonuclease/phosphatase family protein [Bacteroidota bacterium]